MPYSICFPCAADAWLSGWSGVPGMVLFGRASGDCHPLPSLCEVVRRRKRSMGQ